MAEIRQYVLSIIAISLLCGVVQLFFVGSNLFNLVKLITGLMITITVVSPIIRIQDFSLKTYFDTINVDGSWAVMEGQEAARNAMSERIKQQTESYICDKAAELGAVITADVILDTQEPPVPSQVTIRGEISPYVKKQLKHCLQKELGIIEEKQLWIS